ncbi:hypothetical protein VYU27_006395 [Nannochloropsis oceanica]
MRCSLLSSAWAALFYTSSTSAVAGFVCVLPQGSITSLRRSAAPAATAAPVTASIAPGPAFPHSARLARRRLAATTRLFMSTSPSTDSTATTTPSPPPTSILPYPKLGDVVLVPGKWAGDFSIGQIRFLQKTTNGKKGEEKRESWIADVAPFKEIGEDLYRAEKGGRAGTYPVGDLKPLSYFFIGSSDAFKVPHKLVAVEEGEGGREGGVAQAKKKVPVQMAPAYTTEGFSILPPKLDQTVMEASREKYDDLKKRILSDTAIFGLVATGLTGVNAGVKDAEIFLAGVVGSLVYLVLLTQKADDMGRVGGKEGGKEGGLIKGQGGGLLRRSVGSTRFLVPVILIAGLAYKNLYVGGEEAAAGVAALGAAASGVTAGAVGGGGGGGARPLFNYVPQDEFWAATLGFLSYRVPMLGREIGEIVTRRSEKSKEEAKSVGGSVRMGLALVDRLKGGEEGRDGGGVVEAEAAGGAYRNEVTVLVVSGPEGMNKRALAKKLVEEDPLERYKEPVWVTTRTPREGERDGIDYHFVEDFAFQVMRERGNFLVAYKKEGGKEAGGEGGWYGLRPSDLEDVTRKEGKVSVLALNAYMADKLLALNNARIIATWVTLNTVEQLRERYMKRKKEGGEGAMEEEVEAAVSRATAAIEHALLGEAGRRGFYEHTIYDDKGEEETLKKLRDFADFALSL